MKGLIQMKDFYIFLDIDGVLFDWKYLMKQMREGLTKNQYNYINPDCVNALNHLIKSLEKHFNVTLVISSTWRISMEKTEQTLKENNLDYNKKLEHTPITPNPHERGKEILTYLQSKPEPYDFVILDDETFDFDKYFDSSKIIKTNVSNNSLNNTMVKNFLNGLNIDIEKEIE